MDRNPNCFDANAMTMFGRAHVQQVLSSLSRLKQPHSTVLDCLELLKCAKGLTENMGRNMRAPFGTIAYVASHSVHGQTLRCGTFEGFRDANPVLLDRQITFAPQP